MVLEINTQSKENISSPTVNESDTDSSNINNNNNNSESVVNSEVKKVPPKPAKRVSFLYNPKDSVVNKNNTSSEKIDNDKLSPEVNKSESFIPKSVLKKSNKNGSLNNCDTSLVRNYSSNIPSEGNSSGKVILRNKDIINSDDKEKNIVCRTNSVNQLKSEFVKTNSDYNNYNNQSLLQFNKKSSTNESNYTTDPQSRLSESQSKIAKLQQSLPTKLSEATVQSLKNKYSPSSYGYPKSFSRYPTEIKSSNNTSRIPLVSKHISTVKNKFETGIETDDVELANYNNDFTLKVVPSENKGQLKIKEKKIFKTELYITPEIDVDKNKDLFETKKSSTSFLDELASKDIHSINEIKIRKDTKTNETGKDKINLIDVIDSEKSLEIKTDSKNSISEVDGNEKREISTEFQIKPKQNDNIDEIIDNNKDKSSIVISSEENIEEISLEVNNNTNQLDEKKQEENSNIVVVKAKLIHSEEFPKIECTEKVIVEEDDSDTITLSEDSDNSQQRSISVISEQQEETEETSSGNLTLTDEKNSEVEMEEGPNKKPTKKRSNSFKKIFGFGSSKDKDKKKNEESKNKNGIKTQGAQADNIENESSIFDRNAPQRHTFSGHTKPYCSHANIKPGHYNCRPVQDSYQQYQNSPLYSNQQHFESNRLNSSLPVSVRYQFSSPQENKLRERERLNMNTIQYDLYLTQQNAKRLNSSPNAIVNSSRTDEYVCMDNIDKQNRNDLTQPGFINSHAVNKFIDTTSSSSSCTLESDIQNNIYENALSRKLSNDRSSEEYSSTSNSRIPLPRSVSTEKKSYIPNEEKFYERPKFSNSPEIFTTTPRRIQDPQLIKPKAIIPINTERSLPNPYRNNQDEQSSVVNDNVYGNINKQQINNNIPRTVGKENVYGKPVPAVRKNLNSTDMNYANTSRNNQDTIEDVYGTVYDSLSPVSAQLKITKTNIIKNANKNAVKSRSISPSQRQRNRVVSPTPINTKLNDLQIKKEIEPTKLKLSPNRERLEPRLKSPIDEHFKFSPVLKKESKKKNDEKDILSSHHNLKEQIDNPDNNINEELNKKGTPEKKVFPIVDTNKRLSEPISSKKLENIATSSHVSPVRSQSLQNTTKLLENSSDSIQNVEDKSRLAHVRSPITVRTESPISVASSQSVQSTPRSKLRVSSEDLKDLKNTEVYFWEQTNKLTNSPIKKIDESKENSPENSPQQVLTQVVVHQQPPASPIKSSVSPNNTKVVSPQKHQNMKNLEAFYWQEIKKLKEKEEHEIYNQHLQLLSRHNSMNVGPETTAQHRSRSMSPSVNRIKDKRSLSLPRDLQPQRLSNDIYDYTKQTEAIIEERNLQGKPSPTHYGMVRQSLPTQNPNFVRGSPHRSTIGPSIPTKQEVSETIYENYFPGVELRHQAKSSAYAPIFKRGSLVTSSLRENSPQNKKVSFSNARIDEVQVWPTKNGFTQSPPTRRVEKKAENSGENLLYSNQNISVTAENERNSQQQQNLPKIVQESPYGTTQQYYLTRNEIVAQGTKMQDPKCASSDQVYKINVQNYQNAQQIQQVPNELRKIRSYSVEPIYISSKPPQYPANQESNYTTKKPNNEQIYGRTKQITINNKVCDFYGQIHDGPSNIYGNIQKSGVIYGQLQPNPIPGSPKAATNQFINKSDFVRGTRLTSSFNDIIYEPPRRPLPPIPKDKMVLHGRIVPVVSESESGSEAGEVQRILERREMNRRQIEEEWNSDSKSGRSGGGDSDDANIKKLLEQIPKFSDGFVNKIFDDMIKNDNFGKLTRTLKGLLQRPKRNVYDYYPNNPNFFGQCSCLGSLLSDYNIPNSEFNHWFQEYIKKHPVFDEKTIRKVFKEIPEINTPYTFFNNIDSYLIYLKDLNKKYNFEEKYPGTIQILYNEYTSNPTRVSKLQDVNELITHYISKYPFDNYKSRSDYIQFLRTKINFEPTQEFWNNLKEKFDEWNTHQISMHASQIKTEIPEFNIPMSFFKNKDDYLIFLQELNKKYKFEQKYPGTIQILHSTFKPGQPSEDLNMENIQKLINYYISQYSFDNFKSVEDFIEFLKNKYKFEPPEEFYKIIKTKYNNWKIHNAQVITSVVRKLKIIYDGIDITQKYPELDFTVNHFKSTEDYLDFLKKIDQEKKIEENYPGLVNFLHKQYIQFLTNSNDFKQTEVFYDDIANDKPELNVPFANFKLPDEYFNFLKKINEKYNLIEKYPGLIEILFHDYNSNPGQRTINWSKIKKSLKLIRSGYEHIFKMYPNLNVPFSKFETSDDYLNFLKSMNRKYDWDEKFPGLLQILFENFLRHSDKHYSKINSLTHNDFFNRFGKIVKNLRSKGSSLFKKVTQPIKTYRIMHTHDKHFNKGVQQILIKKEGRRNLFNANDDIKLNKNLLRGLNNGVTNIGIPNAVDIFSSFNPAQINLEQYNLEPSFSHFESPQQYWEYLQRKNEQWKLKEKHPGLIQLLFKHFLHYYEPKKDIYKNLFDMLNQLPEYKIDNYIQTLTVPFSNFKSAENYLQFLETQNKEHNIDNRYPGLIFTLYNEYIKNPTKTDFDSSFYTAKNLLENFGTKYPELITPFDQFKSVDDYKFFLNKIDTQYNIKETSPDLINILLEFFTRSTQLKKDHAEGINNKDNYNKSFFLKITSEIPGIDSPFSRYKTYEEYFDFLLDLEKNFKFSLKYPNLRIFLLKNYLANPNLNDLKILPYYLMYGTQNSNYSLQTLKDWFEMNNPNIVHVGNDHVDNINTTIYNKSHQDPSTRRIFNNEYDDSDVMNTENNYEKIPIPRIVNNEYFDGNYDDHNLRSIENSYEKHPMPRTINNDYSYNNHYGNIGMKNYENSYEKSPMPRIINNEENDMYKEENSSPPLYYSN